MRKNLVYKLNENGNLNHQPVLREQQGNRLARIKNWVLDA
jgi:hypothetical protein